MKQTGKLPSTQYRGDWTSARTEAAPRSKRQIPDTVEVEDMGNTCRVGTPFERCISERVGRRRSESDHAPESVVAVEEKARRISMLQLCLEAVIDRFAHGFHSTGG